MSLVVTSSHTATARDVRAVVSEVYSRPRVLRMVKLMFDYGIFLGFVLDLFAKNSTGQFWDFITYEHRKEPRRMRDEHGLSFWWAHHFAQGCPARSG